MTHKKNSTEKPSNTEPSPNKQGSNKTAQQPKPRKKKTNSNPASKAKNRHNNATGQNTAMVKKPGNKNAHRPHTSYASNKTASLRIQDYKIPVSRSKARKLAAALFTAAKDMTLGTDNGSAPHVKIDVEKDSIEINQKLQDLESLISKLIEEVTALDQQILTFTSQGKEADPALQSKKYKAIEQIDDLLVKKIELIPELIREHAIKRIDAFFYLLVAVYKTNVTVNKGRTNNQHGSGSQLTVTDACHMSLIPNPVLSIKKGAAPSWAPSLFHSSAVAASKAATVVRSAVNAIAAYAPALPGMKTSDPAKTAASAPATDNAKAPTETNNQASEKVAAPAPAENIDITTLLSQTYFIKDVLNMTTELPKIVNHFDCHMEGKYGQSNYVKLCVGIVNRVSRGMLNPVEGLSEFCKTMTLFFAKMEERYVELEPYYSTRDADLYPKGSAAFPYPKAIAAAWKYEKEGTFRYLHPETSKPDWNYVNMMLRHHHLWYTENRFLAMQNEILHPPIEAIKTTSNDTTPIANKP